jgi:hypothetical protein
MKKTIISFLIICCLLTTYVKSVSANDSGNAPMEIKYSALKVENEPEGGWCGNCAVIVCGGTYDDYQGEFQKTALLAKDVFQNKGFKVKYLYTPFLFQVEYAITNWIPINLGKEKQVFIYFVDHGFEGSDSEGGIYLRENVELYPYQLKNWLNKIKDEYSICSIVVDACFSGNFIEQLSDNNRIIITSTDKDNSAYANNEGYGFFSKPFFDALNDNKSYGEAWEIADLVVDDPNTQHYDQNPQLDDNGNGVSVGTNIQDTLPLTDPKVDQDGNLALGTIPPIHDSYCYDLLSNRQSISNAQGQTIIQSILQSYSSIFRKIHKQVKI